jgi:hypothetical protein
MTEKRQEAAGLPAGARWSLGLRIGAVAAVIVLARRKRGSPPSAAFAWAALIVMSLSVVVAAAVATGERSRLIGGLAIAAWSWLLWRWISNLKRRRTAPSPSLPAAPLYCMVVPSAVLLVQVPLVAPLTNASRARAMAASAEVIEGLERYHSRNGGYPEALEALHPDYSPAVVGVEGYRYARRMAGYDLSFEQPRFLLDDIGAREIVVYNPRDQHLVPSHAAWILLFTPNQLAANQGWYSARELAAPHWRSFLFD